MVINNIDLESVLIGESGANYDLADNNFSMLLNNKKNYLALGLFQQTIDKYMSSLYGTNNKNEAMNIVSQLESFIEQYADTEDKLAYATGSGALNTIGNTKTNSLTNTKTGTYVDNFDPTKYQNNDTDAPVDGWTKDRLIKELAKYGYTGTENEDFNKFIKENPNILKVNWLQGTQGDVQNSVIEITLPTGTKITVSVGGDAQFLDKDDHIIGVTEGTAYTNAKDAFTNIADTLTNKNELTAQTPLNSYLDDLRNMTDNIDPTKNPTRQRQAERNKLQNPLFEVMQDKDLFASSLAASLIDHIRENLHYLKNPKEKDEENLP